MEFVHDFLTALLVEPKPGFGRERCFFGLRLVLVNFAQTFQHVLAFLREVLGHVDKLPSATAQTVGQDVWNSLEGLRESASHIWMGVRSWWRGERVTDQGFHRRDDAR